MKRLLRTVVVVCFVVGLAIGAALLSRWLEQYAFGRGVLFALWLALIGCVARIAWLWPEDE